MLFSTASCGSPENLKTTSPFNNVERLSYNRPYYIHGLLEETTMSDYYDSDYSDYSDGEPYLSLKEEVRRGDVDAVREALDGGGANPCEVDQDHGNYTLLHWAVGMTDEDGAKEVGASELDSSIDQRREIVRVLLRHGANAWPVWWHEDFINVQGRRAWDLTEDSETRRFVLEACVDQTLTAICQDKDTPHAMKASGFCAASILGRTDALRAIFDSGNIEVDNDSCDYTALSEASASGSDDTVVFLVQECGADINHEYDDGGRTALWNAAQCGHISTVDLLIKFGADPLSYCNFMGLLVVWVDSEEVRQLLFQATLERLPRDPSETTMFQQRHYMKRSFEMFITFGIIEGLEALFHAGAEAPPDSLQMAVAFGQADALECLMAHGALGTYDVKERAHFYGSGEREPTTDSVLDCQERLEQSLAAREEFQRLQA